MTRPIFLQLVTTTLLFLSSLQSRADSTIPVLAIEYPPFTTQHASDSGLCFRFLNEYSDRHLGGKRFAPEFVPPARAEALLAQDNYCITFYPPRKDKELFGFHPLSDRAVKVGLIRKRVPDEFRWNDFKIFKNKQVAILRRNTRSSVYEEMAIAGADFTKVESVSQALKMLKLERVDMAFGDETSLATYAEELGINPDDYQFSSTYIMEAQIGFFYRLSCQTKIFGEQDSL